MATRVLIIGGYGNFGSYIATSLAGDVGIRLLIGGRSALKAQAFAASLEAAGPVEGHAIDIHGDLAEALARIAPEIVIHTTGPFQGQDHRVARACIAAPVTLDSYLAALQHLDMTITRETLHA